jgi:DNA-binding MarR family transcriptional regulator
LEPRQSPGFLLWHATLRWQQAIAAALHEYDLTHVQFVLLASTWWLGEQGERPNQLALARHAGTDVKMTSQVLRSLERKGLVEREVDPADSRARLLAVTTAGAALAPRAITAVERVDAEFFAAVETSEAIELLATLGQPGRSGPARPSGPSP